MNKTWKRLLGGLLCAALALLAPGPLAMRAFADAIRPGTTGTPEPVKLPAPSESVQAPLGGNAAPGMPTFGPTAPASPLPTALPTATQNAESATPVVPSEIAAPLDSLRPFEERRAGVQALEHAGDKSALERIADSAAQGGAQDYEIHRLALQALARLGTVLPLRPMSRELADEIADQLTREKPDAFFDYDGTLAEFMQPLSAEVASGLKSAADAGVQATIVTVRHFESHPDETATIMESLASLSPRQKAALTVISNTGGRHYLFDRKGKPVLVHEENAARMQKDTPVAFVRANTRPYEQTRALLHWGLPGRLAARIWRLYRYLPALPMEGKKTLIVGDDFMEGRRDTYMAKAAPGALVLAVAGKADPRLENTFVWPTREAIASREILAALGGQDAQATIHKKAIAGLFGQRTAGIAGFILVAIAYVFIAVPVVGWAGYGELMAFSQMAAIATGPLNGLLVNKLSYFTAMLVNTIIRIGLILAVPAFYSFHVMNSYTLLLAAIAEGWLLSSILTVEDAVIKHVFAQKPKLIHSINNLLWMNFLVLQVALGEILQVGQIVDKWNPFYVYLFAGLLNLFVSIPCVFLLPKISASSKALRAPVNLVRETAGLLRAGASALRRYWKEAALFAAAIANYHFHFLSLTGVMALAFYSPLPITVALGFWIARTEGFKSFWRGEYNEPTQNTSKREAGRLRVAGLYIALGVFLLYPLQYFTLPHIAEAVVGQAAKGNMHGQLLGALFFGNLISTASQKELPLVRLPVIGRIKGKRVAQAVVLALAATWVAWRIVPGNFLAAFLAAAAAIGPMALAERLTNRGWLMLFGIGFSALWLPFLVWTFPGFLPFLSLPTALFLSLIAIGMFYAPTYPFLNSYFQKNARNETIGKAAGIKSGLFNFATALGYTLFSITANALDPTFPAFLGLIGILFLIAGALFYLAPRFLPGLPKTLFHPRSNKP